MELKDTVKGMESGDYKERFIAEYDQLTIRLYKLQTMIEDILEGKLDFAPETPFDVLIEQEVFMRHYLMVLKLRAQFEGIAVAEYPPKEKEG